MTREQLLREIETLRQRIAVLERAETTSSRMEESRERERNLLRTLIDNLPDYIYVKDTQYRFVAANAATARIMGAASPDDLLGRTDHDYYPENLAARYRNAEEQVLRLGDPIVNREEPGLTPEGTQRVILTTQVPLKDSRGAVVGLVGVGRDITELRWAEEELCKARDELENRVRQRTAELAIANEELTREIAERERAQEVLRNSEAMYSSLVENLPVYVLRKDLEGRFVFASRSFCELISKSLEELLGKTDFDLYSPDLASKYRQDDKTVLETGKILETVEENHCGDESRYMEIMKSAVRDAAGRIVGVQVVFWDVTQRKAAEAAIERERYLLHALMDNLPHNIYFKDAKRRFIRINKALATLFGMADASQAIGKSDWDYFTEEHARQAMVDEQEILRTGQPMVDKEEKETWADGHTTWAVTTKMPLRDEEGRVVGTFGISRDITERKQTAEALQIAKEAAEAASRAKGAFLANMSHEIRTPLNAIIGMTELVLDSELSSRQRDFLTTVRESGESLLSIINDILDFSKIEAGKLVLDHEAFDLRESLGDAMKLFAVRADKLGLELAFDVHPDVPYIVVGDVNRLRQIVLNLVGNALKFTEKGEVVLDVERQGQSEDEVRLHFTVWDTGIGIPENKRAAVFEMFEQVDNTLTRRHGGTGLGLAIVSRLVELMGGRIWVESEVGRGTRFHFTARLGLAKEEEAEADPGGPASIHGVRVLAVDDNATNCRIIEEMLLAWGMVPTIVSGAAQAMQLLREKHQQGEPYGLVLTDVHMPEIDGFTFAEQIREHADLGSTVVMMLTSGDRSDATARCEHLGIAAYLLKPIKQSELRAAIELALGIVSPSEDALKALARQQPRRIGPLHVLLVEDSLVNQKLAVAVLEIQGHRITIANNGREALEALEADKFDLILMDVQMPEMDGLEATAAIRTREKRTGGHVPIIAMTAHALKGDRQRCLEAGMDAYIAKPIHVEQFLNTIAAAFGAFPAPHKPPPTENRPADAGGVDWNAALKAMNGDRSLLQIVTQAVLDESPDTLRAIRDAVSGGNLTALRLAAHTFKGSIRYFGASRAFDLAFQLEQMGQHNDLAIAQEVLAALEVEWSVLAGALVGYRRRGDVPNIP